MRLTGQPSITWRLTLLFAAASSIVLLALGLVIAASVDSHFEEQDLAVLSGKLTQARQTLAQPRTQGGTGDLLAALDQSLIGDHNLDVIVLGPTQLALWSTPHANFPIKLISALGDTRRPIAWSHNDQTYRGLAATLATGIDELPTVTVAVALNMAHHQAFMRSFLQTLWLFVAGAAVLTGFLGWAVARRGLAPLRAMREQANSVSAQQLNYRLAVAAAPRELVELAQSLNAMLARLEDAFQRLSDFSSDIAHELRTPVSNLMTETQVALSRSRDAVGYRNVLESNAEEFEHMARMISDMLLLAKADNGLVVPQRETLNLATEVLALFDYYEALADDKDLRLSLEGEATVNADRLMLRRALGNLLSNAVRHSTPGSTVKVRLRSQAETVSISMENTGEPIPPEYQERVFDRFFRIDPSRQRLSDGSGLGLAITKSIVLAHGGVISVTSSNDLTTFTIKLARDGANAPPRAALAP